MGHTCVTLFISVKLTYYMEIYSNFPVVTWKPGTYPVYKRTFSELATGYVSRYYEVAFDQMIVTFSHDNWEKCTIPISTPSCVYLIPFSYSESIKITKHCSYLHSRAHFDSFSCSKKYLTDDHMWHIRKNCLIRGYILQKTARWYDQNCADRSDL